MVEQRSRSGPIAGELLFHKSSFFTGPWNDRRTNRASCDGLLYKDLAAFPLNLVRSEFTNSFANMAAVGFFTLTGDRYQMTVPKDLKVETIAKALLRLAATEDVTADFDYPHPEWLVVTMTQQEALEWVRKLNSLTWKHRVADRDAHLAE